MKVVHFHFFALVQSLEDLQWWWAGADLNAACVCGVFFPIDFGLASAGKEAQAWLCKCGCSLEDKNNTEESGIMFSLLL